LMQHIRIPDSDHSQWNELDGTLRDSSGHSNQPHHDDGDSDDAT
jgi:hypothetical protein